MSLLNWGECLQAILDTTPELTHIAYKITKGVVARKLEPITWSALRTKCSNREEERLFQDYLRMLGLRQDVVSGKFWLPKDNNTDNAKLVLPYIKAKKLPTGTKSSDTNCAEPDSTAVTGSLQSDEGANIALLTHPQGHAVSHTGPKAKSIATILFNGGALSTGKGSPVFVTFINNLPHPVVIHYGKSIDQVRSHKYMTTDGHVGTPYLIRGNGELIAVYIPKSLGPDLGLPPQHIISLETTGTELDQDKWQRICMQLLVDPPERKPPDEPNAKPWSDDELIAKAERLINLSD